MAPFLFGGWCRTAESTVAGLTWVLMGVACAPALQPARRAVDHGESACPPAQLQAGRESSEVDAITAAPPATPAAAAARVEPSATLVRLLAPGSSPQHPIRFQASANAAQRLVLTIGTSVNVEVAGMSLPLRRLPALNAELAVRVNSEAKDGKVLYEAAVERAWVAGDDGFSKSAADALRQQVAGLAGARVVAAMTSEGVRTDAEVGTSEVGKDPNPRAMRALERALGWLLLTLPDEPIGRGARWQVTKAVDRDGAVEVRQTTFELGEHQEDTLRLSMQASASSYRQTLRLEELGVEVPVELEHSLTKGSGTIHHSLGRVMPDRAVLDLETSATMRSPPGSDAARSTVTAKVTITLAAAP